MATPVIAALPLAPTRGDGPDDYMVEADAFTAALTPFSIQVNTAVSWMADTMAATLDYKNAAAASATASSNSATQAGMKVVAAAEQVALATTQAGNAATSASNAQTYAAAAQAAVGAPTLVGNKNKVLTVKADESGVLWRAVGQQIGDVMLSLNPPGAEYKLADGATYLQASYPDYIAKVGLIPPNPPTAYDSTLPALSTGFTKASMAMDGTGTYLVIGGVDSSSGVARLEPYKIVSGVATKLATIITTSTGYPYLSFSADGVYLAVAYGATSPYLEVYKRSGDSFTKLTLPALTQGGNSCTFSDDGVYLGITYNVSPYFAAYKRTGDTFTKLTTPVVGATALVGQMAVSADGVYWAISTGVSGPNLAVVKRTGDAFAVVTQVVGVNGAFSAMSMSKDGSYLACIVPNNPVAFIYKRSGDAFVYQQQVNNVNGTNAMSVMFSPDGKYLYSGDSAGFYVYRNVGETFGRLTGPGVVNAGSTSFLCGHFDPAYFKSFVVGYTQNGANLFMFKDTYPFNPLTEFQVPNFAATGGTPTTANTATNTLYPAVKAYVKMKEPA
ncbi:hypothetical protein ACCD10_17720 [Pseudomonas sp. Pseusp122]|uniref:hypothetical protein n=1 Tax=unclassified Pseudomonas TaxID=196821 RepID=UPI0039A5BBAD